MNKLITLFVALVFATSIPVSRVGGDYIVEVVTATGDQYSVEISG